MKYEEDQITLVAFDKSHEKLDFYHFYLNGNKNLFSSIELEQLLSMGEEAACNYVGKIVLATIQGSRNALFPSSLE